MNAYQSDTDRESEQECEQETLNNFAVVISKDNNLSEPLWKRYWQTFGKVPLKRFASSLEVGDFIAVTPAQGRQKFWLAIVKEILPADECKVQWFNKISPQSYELLIQCDTIPIGSVFLAGIQMSPTFGRKGMRWNLTMPSIWLDKMSDDKYKESISKVFHISSEAGDKYITSCNKGLQPSSEVFLANFQVSWKQYAAQHSLL